MNEKQAQELFNQLYNDGYDVADFPKFKEALQTPERAAELYDFFSNEGYDLGQKDNFMLTDSIAEASTARTTAEQEPTPMPTEYSWGPDEDINPASSYAVTGAAQEGLDTDFQAKRALSTEQLDIPVTGNTFTAEVEDRLEMLPDYTKELTSEYLSRLPIDRQVAYADGDWDEGRAAGLAERAVKSRFETLSQDFNTLAARMSQDEVELAQRYVQMRRNNSEDLPAFIEAVGEESVQVFDQYYQTGTELHKAKAAYGDVITKFPEEALRRQKLIGASERFEVTDDDTWWDATYKTAFNSGNTLTNRLLGLPEMALTPLKAGADAIRSAAGADTAQYENSDKLMDLLGSTMEELRLPENTKVFEGGEFQGLDTAIPATVGTLADMAIILGGAEFIGAGGLFVSGGAMAFGDAYTDALNNDLSEGDARAYATQMAVVQGALEYVSPQTLSRSLFRPGNMDVLMNQIKSGAINRGDILKAIGREVGDENVQELLQGVGEKIINARTNAALGEGVFSDEFEKDELLETIALTTASSLLMGGVTSGRALRGQQREAALALSSRQKEFKTWLQENVATGKYTAQEAQTALETIEEAGQVQQQAQAEKLATGTRPKVEVDPTQERGSRAKYEEALANVEQLIDQEAEVSETPEPNEPTPQPSVQALEQAATEVQSTEQAVQEEVVKEEDQPSAPQTTTLEGKNYVKVGEQWHRQKKDGTAYKNPVKDQTKFAQESEGPAPQNEAPAQTVEANQPDVQDVSEPSQQSEPVQEDTPVVEDPVAVQETEEVVTEPITQEADRSPDKNGIAVNDLVEYEGQQYKVKKVTKGKYDLTTLDGSGGVKGATFKEITPSTPDPILSNDTIIFEGKKTKVQVTDKAYVFTVDGKTKRLTKNDKNTLALQEAKALYQKKETLASARKTFVDQIKDTSLKAVFDPKDEAYKTSQFFIALKDLATAWIDYNGSVAYSKFKRSLPAKVRNQVADEILREAFETSDVYEAQKMQGEENRAKAAEANIGNKKSKGAETLDKSPLLDKVQKKELKEKKWKYWNRSLPESDDMGVAWVNAMGVDEAYDAYMDGRTKLESAVQPFAGRYLITALNQRGRPDDARKASQVAEKFVEQGQSFGRGLGAFRGLTMLTPEGLQVWAARQVTTTVDNIKKRNARKVKIALQKLEKAKNEVRYTPDVFTKEQIEKKRKEAWNEFKKSAFGSASAGLDPKVIAAATKYAYYTALKGVKNFTDFVKKMKRTKLTRRQLETIWNTKVAGDLTIADIANKDHEQLIRESLGTEQLSDVLRDMEVTRADAVAQKLNKEFEKLVMKALKPQMKNDVEKQLAKMLADNFGTTKEDLEYTLTETPDVSDLVSEYYAEMQKAPFDFQKQEIAAELATKIARRLGGTSWKNLAVSLWYASILSGPGTQFLNLGSNLLQTIADGFVQTPITFARGGIKGNIEAIKGLMRGWERGLQEGRQILKKGINPTRQSAKFFEADPLEGFTFDWDEFKNKKTAKGMVGYLFSGYPAVMKYVARGMAATDAFFYHGLYESQASAYAVEIAKKKAKKAPPSKRKEVYQEEFAKAMGWEGSLFKDAYEQAKNEAETSLRDAGMEVDPVAVRRGALEIIKQSSSVKDVAHEYAAKGTFNHDPEGLLGFIANTLAGIGTRYEAFKFIVPFTRIVANVLNRQLDYSPYGLKRAAVGFVQYKTGEDQTNSTNAKNAREVEELLYKSVIGTFLLPLLAYAFSGEDEEGIPLVSGRGPSDFAKRKQLLDRGWKPYSIKFGDTWVSYQYTPMAVPMTFLGNMYDMRRYSTIPEEEIYKEAVVNIAPAIFNMSFLSTLGDAFAALTEDDPQRSGLSYFVESQLTKIPTGMVPNFIRSVDKAFDPTFPQATNGMDRVMKNLPFVRRMVDRPMLNVYGQPVKIKSSGVAIFTGASRFASTESLDEVTEVMDGKNYLVKGIGRTTQVNGVELKNSPEDYYDYAMLVGRHFYNSLTDIDSFKDYPPKEFKQVMDARWRQSREFIKSELEIGTSVDDILDLYDLGTKPY